MKKLLNVLYFVGLSLIALIIILFAFIEIRSIFAGDFTLMENKAASLFAYLFRGLYFLLILLLIALLMAFKAKNKPNCIILLAGAISLLIGAFLTLCFYDLIVSLVLIAINIILTSLVCFNFFKNLKENKDNMI